MFKFCLITTLDQLYKLDDAEPFVPERRLDTITEDTKSEETEQYEFQTDDYNKEMPLALRLEKYQRQKLLKGLKPDRDQEAREQIKYLHSLKFIQRFVPEDAEVDEVIARMRE